MVGGGFWVYRPLDDAQGQGLTHQIGEHHDRVRDRQFDRIHI